MQITLRGVGYTYPGAADPALSDVTVAFPQGWTGIVGPNGSGKTTLASIACGRIAPTQGSVSAPACAAALCEQQVLELPANAFDVMADWGRAAVRLRSQLAIEDDWAWRFDTLSAGERKRLQLACALAAEPDLLVLDEPTNFLDAPSRALVAAALHAYTGVGLLISHDRALLDDLVERCVFVEGGRSRVRPGSYSAARGQAELERDAAMAARTNASRELKRLEHEKQHRAAAADRAQTSRSGRKADPRDHDAREKRGRYIVSGQDGKRGQLSAALDSRVAAARCAVDANFVAKRYDGSVWLDAAPHPRKTLVRLPETELPLGSERRLRCGPLVVGHRDRIGITGPNGAGKSTLVGHLLAQVPPDVKVLAIPQEPDATEVREFLAAARRLPPAQLGRALSAVAQLGSRPEALLAGDAPSPGELRKLMLGVGILGDPDLIVMDEPTNHLDIAAVEALERLLAACPCALAVVSHDAAFLDAVASVRWHVENDRVQVRL